MSHNRTLKLKREPTQINHKFCVKCDVEKPYSDFKPYKGGRFGLHSWCNECHKAYSSSYSSKRYVPVQNPKKRGRPPSLNPVVPKKEAFSAGVLKGYKKCRKCLQVKPMTVEFFHKSSRVSCGFDSKCRDCRLEYMTSIRPLVEFDKRTAEGRIAAGLPPKQPTRGKPKPTHKACKKCNEQFPLAEFKTPHGKRGYLYCAKCRSQCGYQKVLVKKKTGRSTDLKVGDLHACKKCGISKPFTLEFFAKDPTKLHGIAYQCRECKKQYIREYNKNHPHHGKYDSVKMRAYRAKRTKDPVYKLQKNINKLISQGLKKRGHKKTSRTVMILGCSMEEFRKHMESKFQPGMTWENYGKGPDKWNIDHHYPQSAGNTEEEILKLNHYTNLQPMWETENLAKRDRVPENWQPFNVPAISLQQINVESSDDKIVKLFKSLGNVSMTRIEIVKAKVAPHTCTYCAIKRLVKSGILEKIDGKSLHYDAFRLTKV